MKRYGVPRVSVYPSVCLSVLHPLLLQVCCCGSGGHEISVDCRSSGGLRANAGSATLSAYVSIAARICFRNAAVFILCTHIYNFSR